MPRSLLVACLAAAFLVAPAALPIAFAPAIAPGLSGSAQAAKNLNSSRSNVNRMGAEGGQPRGKARRSSRPKAGRPAQCQGWAAAGVTK